MAFGVGTSRDIGYGDAESWGGPANGVDVLDHISGDTRHGRTANVSSDTYMAIVILTALALLWLLGGVIFKNARL